MYGLGTPREDEDSLRFSGGSIVYSERFGSEGGAGEYDSVTHRAASGVSGSKSQSKKRSSAEFQDASTKFFESARSSFKQKEQVDKLEGVMKSSRAAAQQSTSAVAHIGNRSNLLDKLAFAEARLKERKHEKSWKKTD